MTFTDQQLNDWKTYEHIRSSGQYNMLDPRARQLTGMSRDDYLFVIENYSALKKAYEAMEDEHYDHMSKLFYSYDQGE
jgi:hypothetical protein